MCKFRIIKKKKETHKFKKGTEVSLGKDNFDQEFLSLSVSNTWSQ